jgi:dipeptidase E
MSRLLLISSSKVHGSGWLDTCIGEIDEFLGASPAQGARRVLFVPYSVADRSDLARRARERFAPLGIEIDSIHECADAASARGAVERARAIVVSGGNTFRLLKALHDGGLIEPIARRVAGGMPYVGWSAGSIVACPTIRTSNDMAIVEPPTLRALGLVPFQINAHYIDADPGSTHMGETREQRLAEFHEENDTPIVAIREGAILRREGSSLTVRGVAGAKVFRRGEPAREIAIGARLDEMLG